MSDSPGLLAARKHLLVARSSLYRLKMQQELGTLRESLRWSRAGAALATSPPARSLLFGLIVLILGRRRLGRLIWGAGRAILLLKLARGVAALLRAGP